MARHLGWKRKLGGANGTALGWSSEDGGLLCHTLLKAAADEVAEFKDGGIRDRVENLQPLFAARNDPGGGQRLQMAGNIRLCAATRLHQRVHVPFAGEQEVQQAQAHGFRQDGETARDQGERFIGEPVAFSKRGRNCGRS